MNKFRFFLFCTLIINNLALNKILSAANLDGTTGTSIYQSTQYNFAAGDFAKGFVCLNGGFSISAGAGVSLGVLQPVSGNINLNSTGGIVLTGDLTLGSKVTIQNGGKIYGQGNTIFLNGDLTIPAGTGFEIASDTVIDGQGHEIIFEDADSGGYIWINGPDGTTLTIRNCIIKGFKNYTDDYGSIVFGDSDNQKLVFNEVDLHLTGNYNFSGGMLDIKNYVNITGNTYKFIDNSEYEITIKSDSTLFIDTRTSFTYNPIANKKKPTKGFFAKLFIMEDKSSRLFLNGCTLELPQKEGLNLTNGHVLVDHKTIIYGNYTNGMTFGNGKEANDLLVDIMPGATFEMQQTTLRYNNSNWGW